MSSTVLPSQLRPFPPSPAHSAGYPLPWQVPPPSHLKKVHEASLVNGAAFYHGGLRTPPAETANMSTAYQHPVMANTYDSHVAMARQPSALMQASRSGNMICDTAVNPFTRTQPHHQQHPTQYHPQTQSTSSLPTQPSSASSRYSTRPSTPGSTSSASVHSEGTVSRRDSTMVMHSLQLPSCISPNGGSLDEFAALMTCFFWFETMDTVRAAEQIQNRRTTEPLPRMSAFTEPTQAYKKWVHGILSTTQVTQNVVLLALLFVYRLKRTNPKVNGNPGSEYRLLTVALMLGNKFLDDNTYTNKTWAEVSGIAVKEIHVMEVEFLSNMRYGLLTSKEQWQEWLTKLSCYHDYCERARMEEKLRQAQPTPMHVSSPTHRGSPPLPSPTNALPPAMTSTPVSLASAYSPNPPVQNQWNGAYRPTPSISPLSAKPSLGYPLARKRSLEDDDRVEPAAKRVPHPPAMHAIPSTQPPQQGPTSGQMRLPVPQLTLDTSQAALPTPYPAANYPSQHQVQPQAGVSLPPLGPGVRAMSTVYPTATSSWAPQGSVMATCGPQTPSYVMPPNYGTPSKRPSPTGLTAYGSSPLTDSFGTHTPISNSPSVYLHQRASPYKPVRRVHTLLDPPPSIPLSQYHLGSSQMHYQPLGRRNDLRTGILPEFQQGYGQVRHPVHY
ncbi:hypothetical protein F4780DRAFT_710832 [Xylariomycetidae sp. FL0641]|nr:hypothetical protein F4780DRAFT_710832 [Xylariomycetidae sp. FL0641]